MAGSAPVAHPRPREFGVGDDNRLENLRIVCPNCAATLETHSDGRTGWVRVTAHDRNHLQAPDEEAEVLLAILRHAALDRPAQSKADAAEG